MFRISYNHLHVYKYFYHSYHSSFFLSAFIHPFFLTIRMPIPINFTWLFTYETSSSTFWDFLSQFYLLQLVALQCLSHNIHPSHVQSYLNSHIMHLLLPYIPVNGTYIYMYWVMGMHDEIVNSYKLLLSLPSTSFIATIIF